MRDRLNMTEIIKPEKKPEQKNNEKFVDFLMLSQEEEDAFKKRIEQNKGLVRIFVHPYYEKITPYYSKKRAEKIEAINLALQKMLSLPEEKTPPILFFEEKEKRSKLEENIGDIELKNRIYTIPTHESSPEPFIHKKGVTEEEKMKNWTPVIEKLKALGVKKALIGGMQFNVYLLGRTYKNEPDEIVLDYCVGEAIKRLSKDFETEISCLSLPENRRKYEEIKKRANKV